MPKSYLSYCELDNLAANHGLTFHELETLKELMLRIGNLEAIKHVAIQATLLRHANNKMRSADALGISIRGLRYIVKRHFPWMMKRQNRKRF